MQLSDQNRTSPDSSSEGQTRLSWVAALFRLARPRTWIFAMAMWLVAYLSTGFARPLPAVVGLTICISLTAATNLFNIYADQIEDRINLPYRVQLVEQIGYPRLKVAIALCYVLPLLLAVAFTNLTHTLVCLVGALDSIFYSWGVRFKDYLYLSLMSIACVIVLPFTAGWVMARSLQEVSPIVFLLGLFFFSYANLKNLPDAPGDRQRGVRTIFNMYELSNGRWLVFALMVSPYGLLTLLVGLGLLSPHYLWVFVMLPILLVIIHRIPRASTWDEKESVHALGYLYQTLFCLITLIVYHPTLPTVLSLSVLLAGSMMVEFLGIDSRPYDRKLVLHFQPNCE
jgi:4-hydroxybenzoate polyprenyltransferase